VNGSKHNSDIRRSTEPEQYGEREAGGKNRGVDDRGGEKGGEGDPAHAKNKCLQKKLTQKRVILPYRTEGGGWVGKKQRQKSFGGNNKMGGAGAWYVKVDVLLLLPEIGEKGNTLSGEEKFALFHFPAQRGKQPGGGLERKTLGVRRGIKQRGLVS